MDSSLSLLGLKILNNLLGIFSKKKINVTRNSFTDKNKTFENKVYFNLKREEEKIKFEEKPKKIERDQTGLSCGNVTNNISKGRI
jgi:hypothetical protein